MQKRTLINEFSTSRHPTIDYNDYIDIAVSVFTMPGVPEEEYVDKTNSYMIHVGRESAGVITISVGQLEFSLSQHQASLLTSQLIEFTSYDE